MQYESSFSIEKPHKEFSSPDAKLSQSGEQMFSRKTTPQWGQKLKPERKKSQVNLVEEVKVPEKRENSFPMALGLAHNI